MSAADIARLRHISRSQAWRILRALHVKHGHANVRPSPRPDGKGKPAIIWRGRTQIVMEYFAALDKTPDERINELEEALEEQTTRIDQLALDLRVLRDRIR